MKYFIFLLFAVFFETVGTSAMKMSEQFTKLIPTVITIIAYIGAFYLLGLTIKVIPVGIAYAIWSGVGIVLISIIGAIFFKQIPDLPAVIGLLLIISGVLVINVFSKTVSH